MKSTRYVHAVLIILFTLLWVGLAHAGTAGGQGSLPWDTPLSRVAASLTGPVAFSISLIAMAAAGGTLVFGGELSEFARRLLLLILAISFLVGGASFMSILFGVSGAVIS
jgi:type IV secretion system protein VirB2